MNVNWTGSIEIETPVERVYAYLADFPRHVEWAQTVEKLELKKQGDANGVGAVYKTYEKQALQVNRQPFGPFPEKKRPDVTLAEVTELVPNRRIAWKSRPSPIGMGIRAEIAFAITPAGGNRTRLTQTIAMHIPWVPLQAFARVQFKLSPEATRRLLEAQWQACLTNIKTILEREPAPSAA
jgi:uncharacterized membrane protein